MDVLILTLWIIGIMISHLLLKRVVEIDNMNKQLIQEKKTQIIPVISEQEISEEELKKELLDYVIAQEYEIPQQPDMKIMTEIGIPKPIDTTNIIQEFKQDRDLNTGTFGPLQAYEENNFATL